MKIINNEDIRRADNLEKCELLIQIIKGQAIYTQDLKIKEKTDEI